MILATKQRRKGTDAADSHDLASNEPNADSLLDRVRKRFPQIGFAITVLIGVSAGLDWIANNAENLKKVIEWIYPAKPILPYVEILVDRSARMNGLIDNGPPTKWEGAKQALQQVDIFNNEYVALRTFAGPCTEDIGSPDLMFARNGKARLNSALERFAPAGIGNLGNAVVAAIGDMIDKPEADGVRPRIVVITGGGDDYTGGRIAAVEKLQGRYPKIELDFRYIGIQLGDKSKQELEDIKTQTKGEAVYVDNRRDIDRAVTTFLVLEPMENSVSTMLAALNGCVLRLNKVMTDLGEPGAGAADADFRVARDECERSDQTFRDLGDKQRQALGPDFALIYQRASENRDRRERIVSVMEKLIASAKSKNAQDYKVAAQEFSEIEMIYNKQIDDLYTIFDHLKLQH